MKATAPTSVTDRRRPTAPRDRRVARSPAGPGGRFATLNRWKPAPPKQAPTRPRPRRRPASVVVCHRYHEAVELVGRRWSGAILFSLIDGPRYFSDVAAAVPGVSDRLLSQRLRELESEGLVERAVHDGPPARVSYRLSELGRGARAGAAGALRLGAGVACRTT